MNKDRSSADTLVQKINHFKDEGKNGEYDTYEWCVNINRHVPNFTDKEQEVINTCLFDFDSAVDKAAKADVFWIINQEIHDMTKIFYLMNAVFV